MLLFFPYIKGYIKRDMRVLKGGTIDRSIKTKSYSYLIFYLRPKWS